MFRSAFRCLIPLVIGFPTVTAPCPAQGLKESRLELTVLLQDYAGASAALLRGGSKLADEVYRSVDVSIEWLECSPALEGMEAPAPCQERVRPTQLVVQFLSRKMARGVPVPNRVFGYALPQSNRASLFYPRIVDFSTAHGFDPTALLGMALAHEIGHILLGAGSHKKGGLMDCPWDKEDVREAARGRLRFDALQAARIQNEIMVRIEAEQSALALADN